MFNKRAICSYCGISRTLPMTRPTSRIRRQNGKQQEQREEVYHCSYPRVTFQRHKPNQARGEEHDKTLQKWIQTTRTNIPKFLDAAFDDIQSLTKHSCLLHHQQEVICISNATPRLYIQFSELLLLLLPKLATAAHIQILFCRWKHLNKENTRSQRSNN